MKRENLVVVTLSGLLSLAIVVSSFLILVSVAG